MFSLALRNLTRNTRRSITTLGAVAVGYAAVNIFGGFASYLFATVREAYIHEQGRGHVQVWKAGAREYSGAEPENYMLLPEDFDAIKAFADQDDRVLLTAGSLDLSGQLDYDGRTGFFLGRAMKPSARDKFFETSTSLGEAEGHAWKGIRITDDESAYAIGITSGMSENMQLEMEENVILLAPSLDGLPNAVDAQVFQTVEVTSEALDGRLIYLPLELAQNLYQTDRLSEVRLLLKDRNDADAVTADLIATLGRDDLEILPWQIASDTYSKTKRMFDMIFGLVFAIIVVIVTMSVINTIGMAIVERTREIGTLRAMGLKRPGVVKLFGIESVLLGFFGALAGLIITVGFSLTIAAIQPLWEPPMIARAVVWQIHLVPSYLAMSFLVICLFTFAAAIIPARRAAKTSIVDALGHV